LQTTVRSGKRLILATKPFATEELGRSWFCLLSTGFLLAASLAGTLWNINLLGQIVCSILAGLLILRFFVIYHDQQHDAILSGSRLASLIMYIFGVLVLSPVSIWKSSHNHHHNHNSKLRGSHIGSFPVMTKAQFLESARSERAKYLFMRHPLTILFGYLFVFLFGMCIYPFFNHPRKHLDCLVAFVVHLGISVLLFRFFGWKAVLLTQFVPHVIASAIGSYLFYAQHNFPGVSFNDNAGWTYEKAALESSSLMKTSPVMGWFTGNIGYHHIHHLNARIPFYRLPEVLGSIPELQNPKTTSLHLREIMRCIRLKVWDVEAQKMVGLSSFEKRSNRVIAEVAEEPAERS
jgi:omega-6 fatty acid desaturase (delta-12 desaturase)